MPKKSKACRGSSSDLSKLIIQPRCWRTRITKLAWSHNRATIGLRSLVNSLGEVAQPKWRPVNWCTFLFTLNLRHSSTAFDIGTMEICAPAATDTAHSPWYTAYLTKAGIPILKWGSRESGWAVTGRSGDTNPLSSWVPRTCWCVISGWLVMNTPGINWIYLSDQVSELRLGPKWR